MRKSVERGNGRSSAASQGRLEKGGTRRGSGWTPQWLRRGSTKSSVVHGDVPWRRAVSTGSDGGLDSERALLASKMQGLMKERGGAGIKVQRFMFDPDAAPMRVWAFTQGALQLMHWVLIPMHIGFNIGGEALAGLEGCLDILLWIDIALHFRTSVRVLGHKVNEPRIVGMHYLRSWFFLDLLSALPVDGLLWLAARRGSRLPPPTWPLARLPRLLRLRVLSQLDYAAPVLGLRDHLLRIVRLGLLTLMLFHIGACGWFRISRVSGFGETDWAAPAEMHDFPLERQYFQCIYWSVGMMTGLVSGNIPERMHEHVFSLATMTAGVFVYGTVIASVASLVAEGASPQLAFRGRVVRTQRMLRTQRDAGSLEAKSLSYFDTLWTNRRGASFGLDALRYLPEGLRLDILLALSSETLRPVPWLSGADEGFDRSLASRLTLGLYMPAEAVDERVKATSTPRGVFFIHRGCVQVRVRGIVLRDMVAGDHFGVIVALGALYAEGGSSNAPMMHSSPGAQQALERAAREPIAHIAVTFAELFELDLYDFNFLMRAFPRVRVKATAFAVARADEYAQQARQARTTARVIDFAAKLQRRAAQRTRCAPSHGADAIGAGDSDMTDKPHHYVQGATIGESIDGGGANADRCKSGGVSGVGGDGAGYTAEETVAALEAESARIREELRLIESEPSIGGEFAPFHGTHEHAANVPQPEAGGAEKQLQGAQPQELRANSPPTLPLLSIEQPANSLAAVVTLADPSLALRLPVRRTTLTGLPTVGADEVSSTLSRLRNASRSKQHSRDVAIGNDHRSEETSARVQGSHDALAGGGGGGVPCGRPLHLAHNDVLEWVALAGDAASSKRSAYYTASGFVVADASGVVLVPVSFALPGRGQASLKRAACWLMARLGRGSRASAVVAPAAAPAAETAPDDEPPAALRSREVLWPIVLPRSRAHRAWVSALCALLAYHALTTPFMLGFGDAFSRATSASSSSGAMARFLDSMSFALLWVDMAANALCAAYTDENGLTEVRPLRIARHYWRTGRGKLDLLSVLPYADLARASFALAAWAQGAPGSSTFGEACRWQSFCAVRLLRLPVLLRVPQLYHLERERFEGLRGSVLESATHTFARLAAIFLYLTHICACAYFIVAREGGTCGQGPWSPPADLCDSSRTAWSEQYLASLFWGLAAISGLGVREEPSTTAQYIFTVVVFLVGLVARAHLIGHVGVLLLELDPTEAQHNKRRAAVLQQLEHAPRGLEPTARAALTQRVAAYFDYVWGAQHGVSMESVLAETDSRVRKLVSAHMGSSMVRKVPLLSGCDEATLAQIGRLLVVRGYPQGEFLIHKVRAHSRAERSAAPRHTPCR